MDPDRSETLVRLLAVHQTALLRYVLALVPNEEDARDVVQEANVALYRKFDEYDPSRPFLAWAFRFAYHEVLKHRERNQRGGRALALDLVEQLAGEREALEPELEARLAALDACLEGLSADDRALVRRRYYGDARADELCREAGESRRTLFRRLDRIRRRLYVCISRRTDGVAPG